jgi:hypothetical protein
VLATRTNTTKQAIPQGEVAVSKWWEDDFIPTCRGKWTNDEYQCETNHRETINHNIKRDTKILSRGSRAYRHASPRCVDQHYVVRRLIWDPHLSSPRAPQEPTTSEILNDTRNILELPYGSSPGKVQSPSHVARAGHEQSPTRVGPPLLLQAI